MKIYIVNYAISLMHIFIPYLNYQITIIGAKLLFEIIIFIVRESDNISEAN